VQDALWAQAEPVALPDYGWDELLDATFSLPVYEDVDPSWSPSLAWDDPLFDELEQEAKPQEKALATTVSRESKERYLRRLVSRLDAQVRLRREEFLELRQTGRLIARERMLEALQPLRGIPLYLTVDLDWFDPAVMAGTGTPEPGGFLWSDFAELVAELRHHNLVAADVVELAPQLDPSGVSSVLASKVVRSLLMLLHQ